MQPSPLLTILHEGSRYVAINKPAGIATEKNFTNDTVEARALEHFRRPRSLKSPYVGIVHRLDRPTSGVLLLALNKSTLLSLNQAFADRKVRKTYLAVTDSLLPERSGRLRHYLARDRMGRRAVASTRPLPNAKEAVLDYELLRTHDGLHCYAIQPVTGRFHQIRVQLSALGCPVFGDADYGSQRILGAHRIALHAATIVFPDPLTGQEITVEAPLPEDWPLHQNI